MEVGLIDCLDILGRLYLKGRTSLCGPVNRLGVDSRRVSGTTTSGDGPVSDQSNKRSGRFVSSKH